MKSDWVFHTSNSQANSLVNNILQIGVYVASNSFSKCCGGIGRPAGSHPCSAIQRQSAERRTQTAKFPNTI